MPDTASQNGNAAPAVAYVLKMFPRFSETFILSELLELERQGVRVHVFSLKRPNDGLVHADVARVRAPVTYLPEWRLRSLPSFAAAHFELLRRDGRRYVGCLRTVVRQRNRAALKHFAQAGVVARALDRAGVEHVHAHFASTATSVALHVHRLTGVPYSFTAHAKDIYRETVRPQDLARKLRAARFAVTVSDYNRRHLAPLAGSDRLMRIYNGLDLAQFTRNGERPDDPPLVLAVGRLIEKKGFDDLVRACALLRDDGIPFRCFIVGKGELKAELETLAHELGVDGDVELAGAIPREALVKLYPRASVFAAPCVVGADGNRDGLPTVLIEAMALRVPVVATPVTGIPELVEHERTGLLVAEHDPRARADALGRLLGRLPD